MKNTVFLILFSSIIFLSPFTSYSTELDINFHRQNTQVWCWAATIAMVAEYVTGDSIEDCEVLSIYDRSRGGAGRCCQGDRRCVRTGQTNEMSHILNNLFNISGDYISRPPSFQELKKSINNGHPLIATLQKRGSGHVVVIAGYRNPNMVIVLDPMNGKNIVNYNTLIANYKYGYWTGSFLISPEKRGRATRPDTRHTPMQVASQCFTQFGSCFMNVPIPVGSQCTCFTPRGNFPGIAN